MEVLRLCQGEDGVGWTARATTSRTVTNPDAPAVTTWNYDTVRGFLFSKTYHDGQGLSYTYYADGRLHTRTWARFGVPPFGLA